MTQWIRFARFRNEVDLLFFQNILEMFEIEFIVFNRRVHGLNPITVEMNDMPVLHIDVNQVEFATKVITQHDYQKFLIS